MTIRHTLDKIGKSIRQVGRHITIDNVRRGIGYVNTANEITKHLKHSQNENLRKIANKVPTDDLDKILGISKEVLHAIDTQKHEGAYTYPVGGEPVRAEIIW